jgi:hypothetical protein
VAWDASRPVPWARLLKPFLIYAVIANLGFLVLMGDRYDIGVLIGTLIGGVVYIGLSAALVKFGWNPPGWTRRPRKTRAAATAPPAGSARPRPAPTKRTNATNPRARRR